MNDNLFRWNGAVGYRYIAPTGLYHAGAREYDPTVGRWLQRDPIGMAGGHPNLYVYCANNPVEAADPAGLRHFAALGRATNLPDETSWWESALDSAQELLSLPWKALKWALGYNQTKLAPGTAGFGAITGDPYRDGTEEGDELADLIDQYGAGSRAIGQTAARGAEQVLENYVGIGVGIVGARISPEAVAAARARYPKLARKPAEYHHITPIYLGGSKSGPTTKLDAAYHQVITNAFRKEHPYGQGPPLSSKLKEIMDAVYSRFPIGD